LESEDADPFDIALGLAIRLRRHAGGMNQARLGEAIGVSFQQVQKYERGTNRISVSTLVRMCGALGCSVSAVAQDVERIVGRGDPAPLTLPEAAPMLEALSEIPSARHRKAVLGLARALAG
jgi:transcriptional regulator with XRE-family HTH domain